MYSFCCVIPVYNHAKTIHDIIRRAKAQTPDVLVLDDGSTDVNLAEYYAGTDVKVIRHSVNRGKGAALLTALAELNRLSFDYMIALDGDGQHYPEDLPRFFPYIQNNDYTLAVGCRDFTVPNVPESSKFGRNFANFWMRLETGVAVNDCQSGFRAYPVKYMCQLHFAARGYAFETESLVRAAWGHLELRNLKIRTLYPVRGERVSHFRPFADNFRISMTHMYLIMLRLLPYPKKRLRPREKFNFSLFNPKQFFSYLLKENATPGALAAAAFMGTVCAVLPLFGFHTPVILYFAAVFHLNKFMAFMIQHPFMPPLAPFLCIELGYFMRYGCWLTDFNLKTFGSELHYRVWEWLLGSLILAPVFAVITALIVYFTALHFQRVLRMKMRREYREIFKQKKSDKI